MSKLQFRGPLHEQVRDLILERIAAGEWSNGTIPGEFEFSRQFGVSVGTVRKAMEHLVREEVIKRARGHGTQLIAKRRKSSRFECRLETEDGRAITPAIQVERIRPGAATASLGRSTAPLSRIERRWVWETQTICRETIFVDEARFPGLASSLDGNSCSLFEIYAERFGVRVARVSVVTGLTRGQLDGEPASDTQPGQLLRCERRAFGSDDDEIERSIQLFALGQLQLKYGL